MKFDLKHVELEANDLMVLGRYLQNALNETNPTAERLLECWDGLSNDIKFGALKYGMESIPVTEAIETYLLNNKINSYGWEFLYDEYEGYEGYLCRKQIKDNEYLIKKVDGSNLFYLDIYVDTDDTSRIEQHKFLNIQKDVDFEWILEYENLLNRF